jgi:heavy metal sensor kinase
VRRRLPVRWRLTLWFTALLGVTLVLFGSIVFVALRARLYAKFDEELHDQVELARANIVIQNGTPAFATTEQPSSEYFLRLLDSDGQVIAETRPNITEVPLDRAVVTSALAGNTEFTTFTVSRDPTLVPEVIDASDESERIAQRDQGADQHELFRIVTEPLRASPSNAIVGALQLGLDRDDVQEPLTQLLGVFALISPLVLLIAAAGGYVLAGRALAPVAAITDLAARVGAQDLHARLQLDLPDDELGRLAQTFDAMLARIEDSFERQRRFTGDAAHELRTPLSLMRTEVDIALARRRSAAAYREALHGLDGDLQRMTGLVGTLLTLARADSGRLIAERRSFDLADTVALILEQYTPVADEAGIDLRAEAESAPLEADEDLLVQVLVNLIDNALAHTPRAGIVTVGCRSTEAAVRLWVNDTGHGIPPVDQARVFDRFFRVDSGRARLNGGTGLGLAICKALIEAHGGTITLTSRIEHGTRVEVALPLQPPAAQSFPR